ncbi:Alpha/Beta hydrolase protein [Aspergillus tamarii]|uniref:Alpha/Beta hydrolase protein n=1 Tax=Aspergillus tamarii TaxID=41984 RepID=A0A5N6VE33_ASPTM|nr:Alpha/Beta hydrolase protein [Aspergillus tamarii]
MVLLSTEWIELEKALGNRPLLKGSPEDMKKQYHGLMSFLAERRPPPDPSVSAKDMTIAGVKCRVYTPGSSTAPRPVGIYTHGGGFVCGDLDSEDALCRVISKAVDCILVSVDYRLGPEHKLPAMLQDTLAVWENASQFDGNPDAFFSIGGSAGAGLALAVANHYSQRDDGRKYIKGVVALVPLTLHWDNVPAEYKGDYTSYDDNADNVPVIDRSTMESFYQAVGADPNDSNIFTALSPHLPKFPPTYICTCGADPLRDDGTVMEKALRKFGVPTKLSTYPNLPHYFWIFPDLEASGGFISDVIAGTNWVISQFPTGN